MRALCGCLHKFGGSVRIIGEPPKSRRCLDSPWDADEIWSNMLLVVSYPPFILSLLTRTTTYGEQESRTLAREATVDAKLCVCVRFIGKQMDARHPANRT